MFRTAQVLLVALLLNLAACQSLRENQARWHRAHDVPPGSALGLTADIEMPAGRSNIYIQGGQVRAYGSTDLYSPHCELVLLGDNSAARTIHPDSFEIYRSVQEVNPIYGTQTSGVASVMGEGESRQMFQTTMYLRSTRQPQVYQLVCGQWVYGSLDDYLIVEQIREVLGQLFMLKLAGFQQQH